MTRVCLYRVCCMLFWLQTDSILALRWAWEVCRLAWCHSSPCMTHHLSVLGLKTYVPGTSFSPTTVIICARVS